MDVYLDPGLDDEGINLKNDVRDTFDGYNPIPARNPHMQASTIHGNHEMVAVAFDHEDQLVYGATVFHPDSSAQIIRTESTESS